MEWNSPATKPAEFGLYEVRSFVHGGVRYAQFRRRYGWTWSAATPKLAMQIRSPGRQDQTWRHMRPPIDTARHQADTGAVNDGPKNFSPIAELRTF